MSICCCDWHHFSQIYPAQPMGSWEGSTERGWREKKKGGNTFAHITQRHTQWKQKENNCTVSTCTMPNYPAALLLYTEKEALKHASFAECHLLDMGVGLEISHHALV